MSGEPGSGESFVRGFVSFSVLPWTTAVIGFVSVTVATRVFAPEELGRITNFNMYGALFAAICYIGLDQAFVRFYHEPPSSRSRRYLFTASLLPPVLLTVLISVIIMTFWRPISVLLVGEPDFLISVCLCVFALTSCIGGFLNLLYRMHNNPKWYTIQGILISLSATTVYLGAGIFSSSHRPAILLMTISTAIWTVVFIFFQRKSIDWRPTKPDRVFVNTLVGFALPLVVVKVLAWGGSNMAQVILRSTMGFNDLGIYSAAVVLSGTINLIQSGFSAYWSPYAYAHYKEQDDRFWSVHCAMACLLVFFVLVLVLGRDLVFLILGARYRSAAPFFPFLLIQPICNILAETTGIGIGIARRTYWTTIALSISIATSLALCIILIPPFGLTGAAIAPAVAGIVILVLRTIIGGHYYKAIHHAGYAVATVSISIAAACANLWLTDALLARSAMLGALLLVAIIIFRRQLSDMIRLGRGVTISLAQRVRHA